LDVAAGVLSGNVEFPVETTDQRSGVSGRTSGSHIVIEVAPHRGMKTPWETPQ